MKKRNKVKDTQMNTFAYIASPDSIEKIKIIWPSARYLPSFAIKVLLRKNRLIKTVYIKGIKSILGKEISGFIALCPLLEIDNLFLEDKLMEALVYCQNQRVSVIGIDGRVSSLADRIYQKINSKIKTPITDGNAFTAWSVVEAIYRYIKTKGRDIKNLTLYISDSDTVLGRLCKEKLSEYTAEITESISEADIVVILHPGQTGESEIINKIKSQAVLCEVYSYSGAYEKIRREDIFYIRGGLVKLPYPGNIKIKTPFPPGVIWTSLAETMLFAFAKIPFAHHFGSAINPDIPEEIANIAVQHGFEVWVPEAPLI
ncbi:MAG: hypothetical protein NC923_04675 [Candidatus Omnitrophica bacterium]|nr:hypothetical protein [Candidatus Omnitrophota bacterium]